MRGSKLAGSLLVHAVALAAITRACSPDEPVPREIAVAPVIELVAIEVVPLEVAVGRGAAPAPSSYAAPSRRRIATSIERAPATPELAPPARAPGQLAMRGLRHDLALPPGFAERVATPATTETPTEPRWAHDPKIELAPTGGGTHIVRDRVATIRVARDGSVAVTDRRDFDPRLTLPTIDQLKRRIGRGLTEWLADPYRNQRHGPTRDLPAHLQASPDMCQSYGDRFCETAEQLAEHDRIEDLDEAAHWGLSGVGVQNRFKGDFTAWLHRKYIGDPYASRKLKVLDQTRDERVRVGTAHRAAELDRSAEHVQRNLEVMWRTTPDPAARRRALFALWDECTEGDDAAGAAGDRARAMVTGWIRARLPAGSAAAFSAGELVRLNARRTSRAVFAPY